MPEWLEGALGQGMAWARLPFGSLAEVAWAASTVKKCAPGCLVLHKESMTMKFNKHVIVAKKAINRKKVFVNVRDMQDIFKLKR